MMHSAPAILLVDDDPELGQMLTEYLSAEAFRVTVAATGAEALERLAAEHFDLMILDVMLPSVNGFAVLRARPRPVPVIMLTARHDSADRLLGFELGADDYVTKPFDPQELVARIRAVLRRASGGGEDPVPIVTVGALQINTAALDARLDGTVVPLTGAEFRILEALMRGVGQIQSRDALTERVLGRRLSAYDRSIDTHISNLRRKLADAGASGFEIRSVRGQGYVLVAAPEGSR